MITEDYVNFEIAKLLNLQGFDADIDLWYDEKGETFFCHHYNISRNWRIRQAQVVYLCPTLQMAMKWLREEHKVNIEIHYNRFGENYKYLIIYKPEVLDDIRSLGVYYSYEQAAEAALKYCLENLI